MSCVKSEELKASSIVVDHGIDGGGLYTSDDDDEQIKAFLCGVENG